MNIPQGSHEEKKEILELQQDIANTENFTALLNVQTSRVEFQTEMLKHLEDAEANEWVQELHEKNQQKAEKREKEKQQQADLWKELDIKIEEQNNKNIDTKDYQENPNETFHEEDKNIKS